MGARLAVAFVVLVGVTPQSAPDPDQLLREADRLSGVLGTRHRFPRRHSGPRTRHPSQNDRVLEPVAGARALALLTGVVRELPDDLESLLAE